MSFKSFLISKSFFIQLAIALVIVFLLLGITMFGIRQYTNHGETFPVPNLQGMTIEQAEQVLSQQNLAYEITDSAYMSTAEPGSVLGQLPAAGHQVKEGRTVFLNICATAPEQIQMPKLTDISFRQAVNIMQTVGLSVGHVEYVPSEFPNLVLEQKLNDEAIDAGMLVNKGSNISLVIGKARTGEKTVVPNLTGVSLTQAKSELASLFLNVGAVIYDESVENREDSLEAKIWQQRPTHTSTDEIELGASIDIWLTTDETKLETETTEEVIEN